MRSALTKLQSDVLEAFFRREQRFFLTGGAALSGYYLGHRATQDVDLFTTEDILEDAERILTEVADELGGTIERVRTSPEFRRRLLRRGSEAVVVGLVRDRSPQIHSDKDIRGAVRVDTADEIFANKLCAILSRAEVRDLVDVMFLERAGLGLEEGLKNAARKDAGLTAGQLGYVLSQVSLGDDASVPGATVAELRDYLANFVSKLARFTLP